MQARSSAASSAPASSRATAPSSDRPALSREAAALLHEARNAAFAEAAQGRMVRGMGLLQDALSQEPMALDLLSDMAALLLVSGDLAAAATYATQALHIEPTHGASLYALAFARVGQGELVAGRDTLRRLMQRDALDSLVTDGADLLPLVKSELARLEALKLPG